MGIKPHEWGCGSAALSAHQPQVCPLLPCEQYLTWRGGFSTWGASSPSTSEQTGQASGCVSGFQSEIHDSILPCLLSFPSSPSP